MRTGRRDFLQTTGAALLPIFSLLPSDSLRQARAIVARGDLGMVNFCRVPDAGWLAEVRFVLGSRRRWVAEIEPTAKGAEFLGSQATLILDACGCRMFGPAWTI